MRVAVVLLVTASAATYAWRDVYDGTCVGRVRPDASTDALTDDEAAILAVVARHIARHGDVDVQGDTVPMIWHRPVVGRTPDARVPWSGDTDLEIACDAVVRNVVRVEVPEIHLPAARPVDGRASRPFHYDVRFGRPGLSLDGSHAAIWVYGNCGLLCCFGGYRLLERSSDGAWRVVGAWDAIEC